MDKSLRISIPRLVEEGRKQFQGEIEPSAWEQPLSEEVRLVGPVRIDLEATWKDERLWLKGRAKGDWELQCCRCLARSKSVYDVSLDATFEEDDLPDDVLDGLEDWATHLAWLDGGRIRWFGPLGELAELAALRSAGAASPLYRLAETWLRNAR